MSGDMAANASRHATINPAVSATNSMLSHPMRLDCAAMNHSRQHITNGTMVKVAVVFDMTRPCHIPQYVPSPHPIALTNVTSRNEDKKGASSTAYNMNIDVSRRD